MNPTDAGSPRRLEPVPVPLGPAVLDLLPALRRALDGVGPALLPVPADDQREAGALAAAVAAPGVLRAGEDSAADPTAVVIATSGSTGAPKGVLLSGAALRASAEATHARLGGVGRWLLALPARHVAGLQVLVRSLLAGLEPGVLDLTTGFRPAAFATAAEPVLASPGRHYTALVPTQLSRLVAGEGPGLAALRAFDAVLLGGAATPPSLLATAAAAGVRVVTTYGMSETAGGCVYDGVPLAGARVRLTPLTGQDGPDGPAQRDTPDGQAGTGRIDLAGPMLARGYRRAGDPGTGGGAFAEDGWFRTGDVGRWLPDGRLEVVGRLDDMINTGGVKVPPLLVERVLVAQPGVLEACVTGVADPEWGQAVVAAVVPADPARPPAERDLLDAVRAQVGRAAVPRRLRFVAELPVLGPGKVDRAAVRAGFAAEH